ncbi:MAG: carboxylesterase family protein, partial [Novosphingobium sp.]
ELPYVFDTVASRTMLKAIPAEQPVATTTHKLWVEFARTGKPAPNWPAATADDTKVMLIDASGARHVADPYKARLDFVESMTGAK